YAKRMGLPVHKLICASNENNVLFDFFHTGIYNKNREFILTSSPSMDILISSNLERLIYHIAGDDTEKTKELMLSLSNSGRYEITDAMKTGLSDFYSAYAKEEEVFDTIREVYENDGYVIDTHTAVAAFAEGKYRREENDSAKNVIISTASPFKFAGNVLKAIGRDTDSADDFVTLEELSRIAKIDIPNAVKEIRNADILHKTVCDPSEMEKLVIETL
ncbi:MAG: threonine synthase, partial [Lachnospiraceae bacterium]|nr:threonine synthase [Lachnospiraceae bacterium]